MLISETSLFWTNHQSHKWHVINRFHLLKSFKADSHCTIRFWPKAIYSFVGFCRIHCCCFVLQLSASGQRLISLSLVFEHVQSCFVGSWNIWEVTILVVLGVGLHLLVHTGKLLQLYRQCYFIYNIITVKYTVVAKIIRNPDISEILKTLISRCYWNMQMVALSTTNIRWSESYCFYLLLTLYLVSTFCSNYSSISLWHSVNIFPEKYGLILPSATQAKRINRSVQFIF